MLLCCLQLCSFCIGIFIFTHPSFASCLSHRTTDGGGEETGVPTTDACAVNPANGDSCKVQEIEVAPPQPQAPPESLPWGCQESLDSFLIGLSSSLRTCNWAAAPLETETPAAKDLAEAFFRFQQYESDLMATLLQMTVDAEKKKGEGEGGGPEKREGGKGNPPCLYPHQRTALARMLSSFASARRETLATLFWALEGNWVEATQALYRSSVINAKGLKELDSDLIQSEMLALDHLAQEGNPQRDGPSPSVSPPPSFQWFNEDGSFATVEALRRTALGEWNFDKPLARYLLRSVFEDGDTVGDFGAGGGHYAEWLTDTGFVNVSAFDGTPGIEMVTGGRVVESDLSVDGLNLGESFDWVMSLEVGEHLSAERMVPFMDNLVRHARKGLVMSWSAEETPQHLNPLPFEVWVKEVEKVSKEKFKIDGEKTIAAQQAASILWLKENVAVFV